MLQSFNLTGVCAGKVHIEIENDIVISVKFDGGCPGNLIGIGKLTAGRKIDEVINQLKGITCGSKNTSCPDQLAKSLITMSVSAPCCI